MSVAQENYRDSVEGAKNYAVDSSVTTAAPLNQGDLTKMIGTAPATGVAPVGAVTDGRLRVGVAEGSWPPASGVDNTSVVPLKRVPILAKGVFRFKGTNGETYDHWTPVYPTADPQTVTSSSSGGDADLDCIGFAFLPEVLRVVAGATTEIDVILNPPAGKTVTTATVSPW